jgi:deazaflavin-dependent oxidoreductase (nitroreductase family)
MPLPSSLARFNKKVTNRITSPFAAHLPGFAIVTHVGRQTGRTFRTPVNAFRHGDGYVFALTYGVGDWVQNVQAAGGCELKTRGRVVRVTEPTVFTDPARRLAPAPVRLVLGLIDVDQFMTVRRA